MSGEVYYEGLQETEKTISRALYNLSMVSHGPTKAEAISKGVRHGVMLGNGDLKSKGFNYKKGDNLPVFRAEVLPAAAAYGYCLAARGGPRLEASTREEHGFHDLSLGGLHVYGDAVGEKDLEDAFNKGYDAVGTS